MKQDELRKVAGTLPSMNPKMRTEFYPLSESIEVTLEDHSANPYKAMFAAATATWGDNKYERKWKRTSVDGRYEVIKAVLTHNTLPQAREVVNFLFRVRGLPRWLFDSHTQTPFCTFMSIGCRDNNKLDCDFIFDDKTFKKEMEKLYIGNRENALAKCKNLYKRVLDEGRGSWQSARAFLPQSYQHSYHFSQNLLSLASMKFEGKNSIEMSILYEKVSASIYLKFPLLGLYLCNIYAQKFSMFKEWLTSITFDGLISVDKIFFERI